MTSASRLVPRAVRCARRALGVVRERVSRIAVLTPLFLFSAGLVSVGPAVTAASAQSSPIQLGGITVGVVPPNPCAGQSVGVVFTTCACATQFTSAGMDPNGGVRLDVATDPSIVCIRCDSLAATVPLGTFAAGTFDQLVRVVVTYGHAGAIDSVRTFEGHLVFQVGSNCGPGSGVLYLDSVTFTRARPCDLCPDVLCAGDSIGVRLRGTFPATNFAVDHVEVVPSMVASPLPAPGSVRVFYRVCGAGATVLTPWSADVVLPPLPARSYLLPVSGFLYNGCDVAQADPVGTLLAPFTVVDSCDTLPPPPPPPAPCFTGTFLHVGGSACDAFLSADQPADVTFGVRNTVALAGLQGRFAFDTPGLQVTDVAAVGEATGMLLSWQPTADGASFVLVATHGAPILPLVVEAGAIPMPSPVLRVRVAVATGVPVPDHARLVPLELVAADSLGQNVPGCVLRYANLAIDPAARLCHAAACDFNGDGVTDVRDLVVMAHCILDASFSCPPGAADHLDCNGDGVKDVGDVICCARVLLAGLPGGGVTGRPAPDVRVTLGAPRATAQGVDVPVTLAGLTGVGAARVDFSYPDARYDVSGVDLSAGDASGWLTLQQAAAGRLTLGLVALGANAGASVPAVVHLSLRAGQAAGGEFGLEGGEFAGQDGAALTTQVAPVSLPLAGGAGLVLTAPRPNPFGASTSFTLVLPRAQAVDVGVFDLAGRRVATLFHGQAAAGPTALGWDRTRSDGALARTGVYFLRVTAESGAVTSKLLVLSRR